MLARTHEPDDRPHDHGHTTPPTSICRWWVVGQFAPPYNNEAPDTQLAAPLPVFHDASMLTE